MEHSTIVEVQMWARIPIGILSVGGERRLERMDVKMMAGMRICLTGMIRMRWSSVINMLPRVNGEFKMMQEMVLELVQYLVFVDLVINSTVVD